MTPHFEYVTFKKVNVNKVTGLSCGIVVMAWRLPREVISLVHHVELNRAGWWNKSVQNLIVTCIWLSGNNLSVQDIVEQLQTQLSVRFETDRVHAEVDVLLSSGDLIRVPGGLLKLSERKKAQLEEDIKKAEETEKRASEPFTESVRRQCPSLNPEEVWRSFVDDFLVPLIHSLGARTYDLICGATRDVDPTLTSPSFLQRYPPETRGALRTAAGDFLDPKNPSVRSFLFSILNSYFFMEATSLPQHVLDTLYRSSHRKPSFTIFADTNFLFSILGLHENPSNDAATALLDLAGRLAPQISIKFYLSPVTLDEAKHKLTTTRDRLAGWRLHPNLAEAAATVPLSGLVQRFVESTARARKPLDPRDYFDPYITNTIEIAKSKGIELWNQRADDYKARQDVIDDVSVQLAFEQRKYGDRAKGYEELLHDVVLWHFVHDKRPARVESPLDAQYWIATVDYRYLGFDAYKRRDRKGEPPVCLHPTALAHVLQFWVPRTPEFEEAVLHGLRFLFLPQQFDPAVERVTVRILEALARFEGVEDLSSETVARILMNDGLRQRLLLEPAAGAQVELIREALIQEEARLRTELTAARTEVNRLTGELQSKEGTVVELKQRLEETERKAKELERQLGDEVRRREEILDRLTRLEAEQRDKASRQEFRRYLVTWVASPVLLLLVGAVLAWLTRDVSIWPIGQIWGRPLLALLLASALAWLEAADRRGSSSRAISDTRVFKVLHRIKNWIRAGLGAILLGVVGNAVYEWIKRP